MQHCRSPRCRLRPGRFCRTSRCFAIWCHDEQFGGYADLEFLQRFKEWCRQPFSRPRGTHQAPWPSRIDSAPACTVSRWPGCLNPRSSLWAARCFCICLLSPLSAIETLAPSRHSYCTSFSAVACQWFWSRLWAALPCAMPGSLCRSHPPQASSARCTQRADHAPLKSCTSEPTTSNRKALNNHWRICSSRRLQRVWEREFGSHARSPASRLALTLGNEKTAGLCWEGTRALAVCKQA